MILWRWRKGGRGNEVAGCKKRACVRGGVLHDDLAGEIARSAIGGSVPPAKIMMLGAKARYAVMAMVDLAMNSGDKPVKLAEIALRQDIPQAYLEQILSRLRQNGLVKSVKGPGGGYMLVRVAKDLPISDIVDAAEEEMRMTQCESKSHMGCTASKERCLTHDLWEGLSSHIHHYFHTISLEDVCRRKLPRGRQDLS